MEATMTWKGMVLGNRERNMHDDSDFYVTVWNEAEQRVEEHEIGSTRYGGGRTYMEPDASPEVFAKARAWVAAQDAQRARYIEAERALRVDAGKSVRFLGTGRKHGYRAGDVGECLRVEASAFRTYYSGGYNRPENNMRAQVRLLDGRCVWVDAARLEVVCENRAELVELAQYALGARYAGGYSIHEPSRPAHGGR